MNAERKVQIKAIKSGGYRAGKIGGMVMISNGRFIVYMQEKDCMVDISRLGEMRGKLLELYREEKIREMLKPAVLTEEARIVPDGRMLRLYKDRESEERIWIDNRYAKMFRGCLPYSIAIEEKNKAIAYTRSGKVIGLVLPVRVMKELNREGQTDE